jgi:hypothetical protein
MTSTTETESMDCQDCDSEVKVTQGARLTRYRVIHADSCPWFRQYQAGTVTGRIPCGATVTHRGPYTRQPMS